MIFFIQSPHFVPGPTPPHTDIFCVNQHEGRDASTCDQLREILSTCERTVLAVDPDGACFQTTACLWEAWVTASLDK